MTQTEHLLTIAAEECAEVAQRCTKALRFGLAEIQPGQPLTNAQRIMGEFEDLRIIIDMLQDAGALPPDESEELQYDAKWVKVKKFIKYARECGTIQ